VTLGAHLLLDVLPHLALAPIAWFARKEEQRSGALFVWAIVALGLVVLAVALTGPGFGPLRLIANIAFIELPLLLALLASALWIEKRVHAVGLVVGTAAIVALAVHAFVVEPRALAVTRYELQSSRVPQRFRIVVVSDLQFDAFGDYERNALRRAVDERPDLLLFTGDYVQAANELPLIEEAHAFLKSLAPNPRFGVYATEGNVDGRGWTRTFDGIATTFGPMHSVTSGPVSVTGLDLRDSFDPSIEIARAPGFHIVVGHAPDFSLGHVDADLLVAGHTHGGQVQIPFLGPLITLSAIPRREAAGGLFPRRDGSTLVVSRGIGLERGLAPRLRLNCRPEIVVIDVLPGS
jgi:uncharacterized protein